MQKKQQQRRGNNQANNQPSSVLLIVINNKANKILTHDIFFKLFSQYGEVFRILIFERSLCWKAFIEMDTLEHAIIAKNMLNNYQLEETKMCIYFSTLQNIIFQEENNSGGVDYTILKKKIEEIKQTKKVTTEEDTICNVILDQECNQKQDLVQQKDLKQNNISKSQNLNQTQSILASTAPSSTQNKFLNSEQTIATNNMIKSIMDQNVKFHIGINQRNQAINEINQQANQKLMISSDDPIQQKFKKNYYSQDFAFNNQLLFSSTKLNYANRMMDLQMYSQHQPKQFSQFQKNSKQFDEDKAYQQQQAQKVHNELNLIVGKSQDHSDIEEENSKVDNESQNNISITKALDNIADVKIESEEELNPDSNDGQEQDDKEITKQKNLTMLENHIDESIKIKSNQSVNNIDGLIINNKQNNNFKSVDMERNIQINKFCQQQNENPLISSIQNCNSTDYGQIQFSRDMPCLSMDLNMKQNKSMQNQIQEKGAKQGDSLQLYQDITEKSDLASYVNPLFFKGYQIITDIFYSNQIKLTQHFTATRKSKVIYARWFEREKVNMNMLYNMFSTFGNIIKMIFIKEKCSVLIEYQQVESAQIVKEYLNDLTFLGQQIKIFYSNYEEIFIKNFNKDKPPSDTQEEYFIGSEQTNRFKGENSIAIFPPSDTLHVSNLKTEACNVDLLKKLFENYGKIERIKFILKENNKNMCLIQFQSKEIALVILAHFHNYEVCGRKIQISFSKLKL